MTVKELKKILEGLEDERVVYCDSFYNNEVNGHYLTTKDDKAVVMVNNFYVQQRNVCYGSRESI